MEKQLLRGMREEIRTQEQARRDRGYAHVTPVTKMNFHHG